VRKFSPTGMLELFSAYQTGDFSPYVRLEIFLRTVSYLGQWHTFSATGRLELFSAFQTGDFSPLRFSARAVRKLSATGRLKIFSVCKQEIFLREVLELG